MAILSFFNQGWIADTIAILGIAITGWLYLLSLREPQLTYEHRALVLVGADENKLPSDIEIKFKGQTVERVTKSQLVIWNSGRRTLLGSDVVQADPLKLVFPSNRLLLDARIVKETRHVNAFSAVVDSNQTNSIPLSFDFLDPRDGVILEIIHDGGTESPIFSGTVRGLSHGAVNYSTTITQKYFKNDVSRASIPIGAFALLFLLGVYYMPTDAASWVVFAFPAAMTCFFILSIIAIEILSRKRYPAKLDVETLGMTE